MVDGPLVASIASSTCERVDAIFPFLLTPETVRGAQKDLHGNHLALPPISIAGLFSVVSMYLPTAMCWRLRRNTPRSGSTRASPGGSHQSTIDRLLRGEEGLLACLMMMPPKSCPTKTIERPGFFVSLFCQVSSLGHLSSNLVTSLHFIQQTIGLVVDYGVCQCSIVEAVLIEIGSGVREL